MSSNTPLKHLGLIIDGNRRWAKERNLSTFEGHRQGAEVLKEVGLEIFNKGIEYVSVYAFSVKNWQRSENEITFLMNLMTKVFKDYVKVFGKKGIRIRVIGGRDRLSPKVLKVIEDTEKKTVLNTKGTLALCFNYGGKEEIIDAIKSIPKEKIASLNTNNFEQYMYSSDLPPVDLVIRTSGEQRLSDFMLWNVPYSELIFLKKLWPDFDKNDLKDAIDEYKNRIRRFGK